MMAEFRDYPFSMKVEGGDSGAMLQDLSIHPVTVKPGDVAAKAFVETAVLVPTPNPDHAPSILYGVASGYGEVANLPLAILSPAFPVRHINGFLSRGYEGGVGYKVVGPGPVIISGFIR